MIHAADSLHLDSGLVLAVPIPDDAAAEGQEVESAIQTALSEAQARGIKGNEVRVGVGRTRDTLHTLLAPLSMEKSCLRQMAYPSFCAKHAEALTIATMLSTSV